MAAAAGLGPRGLRPLGLGRRGGKCRRLLPDRTRGNASAPATKGGGGAGGARARARPRVGDAGPRRGPGATGWLRRPGFPGRARAGFLPVTPRTPLLTGACAARTSLAPLPLKTLTTACREVSHILTFPLAAAPPAAGGALGMRAAGWRRGAGRR